MYCMAEVFMLTRTAEMHRDKIIKYTLAYQGHSYVQGTILQSAPKAGFASLEDLKLLKNAKKTQPAHELKVKIT